MRGGQVVQAASRLNIFFILVLFGFETHPAHALPAFAAQTGQPCTACHVGAFGPQLTQYGRLFKITGYTMQGGSGPLANIPLSAFLLGSYTNTDKGQGSPAAEHYGANGNFAVDQISVYLAGRVSDHFGGFVQGTFDGVASAFALDNTDLRAVEPFTLKGHDVESGLSLNNGPMVQDPYNTGYAWNYPYVASALAPTPQAGTVLGGPLLGNTVGLTAYAWVDQALYLEAGGYETMAPRLLHMTGTTYGPGSETGIAPYARIAYEWNWGANSAHIGEAAFYSRFNPTISNYSTDGSMGHDTYADLFTDAGYQFIPADGRHSFTVDSFYNHESQDLKGTSNAGGSSQPSGYLHETRTTLTYFYQRTYGLIGSWQKIWGRQNATLYPDDGPVTGSANGKPNSNAFIIEAAWIPFGKSESWGAPLANLRLGAQYTIYTEFNGAHYDYDGAGRNASDNNTLYLYAWLIF